MSVSSILYSGVSGMASNGKALNVTGDNIANASTVGYKRTRHNFADVLARSMDPKTASGQGSTTAGVQQLQTQGSLQSTGLATDLAINGDGWFAVSGSAGGMDGTFFTRAGQFHWDDQGRLVNADGLAVQGYNVDAAGNLKAQVEAIQVATGQVGPSATTTLALQANLDADAVPLTVPLSLTDPGGTSNYSTSVTVHDSLGREHQLQLCFRKTAPGLWSWVALADGAEVSGGTPGVSTQGASGTLLFDNQGRLQMEALVVSSFSFNGAQPGQFIDFDFGDSIITDAGTGLQGVTSFSSSSMLNGVSQDGFSAGSLASLLVQSDGTVQGLYDNGQQRLVGQVALASFSASDQLKRVGSNLFAETLGSGQALYGQAGVGGRGAVVSGSLERSNVDLAQQFVDMITFQRGFQASAKTVNTVDRLLQELIQLKR
jgi:flagellar hook protein FlgE